MKRTFGVVVAAVAAGATLLYAHDLFIRLDTYFLQPNTTVTVRVLNGTFAQSENWIARDRILDISVVSKAGRRHLDTTRWRPTPDSLTSLLTLETGEPGTYVIGVSTRPRDFGLSGDEFNAYLREDGVPDVLEARARAGELADSAWERYAKHVKAVVQVGERRTSGFDVPLGYPAEIMPITNPYTLSVGGELRVRCLVDGKPVANQLVIAGGEGASGALEERSARTDASGVARFRIDHAGQWYVKFINMAKVDEEGLDYESKWATLTFEVR